MDELALRPVPVDANQARDRALVRIAALAALAITGRLVFLGLPNVALTYFVVFMAGVLDGPRAGAIVGLVAMTVTNLMLSGLHPVLLANGPAMALLGVAGGLLGPWLARAPRDATDRALRATTLFVVGFFGTLVFSVTSDLVNHVLVYGIMPEGRGVGSAALGPYLLSGLAFNLVPGLLNTIPFVVATTPLLHGLRRAGLARRYSATPPATDRPLPT